MAMIEVNNLHKSYGSLEVLRGVSFSVDRGDVVAVIGPSGSGKSTLLRCLIDLESVTGGTIVIDGKTLCRDGAYVSAKEKKAIILGMGMVFQHFNLYPHLSVLQNLTLAPRLVKGRKGDELQAQAMELLSKVGLADRADEMPGRLSGGQKQRVAIAGVMAMKPQCIVLDEPTAMLDPNGRREVIKTVHELNRQEGITVLLITHYMEEVIDADRVVVIDGGHVVMDGTPKEVFSRVKELKKYSLDVPQVTELADELKEAGMDLPYGILSIDELVDELVPLLK